MKHDGLRVFVALSHLQTVHESLPDMVAHGINRRIVGNEEADAVSDVIGNGLAQFFHLSES